MCLDVLHEAKQAECEILRTTGWQIYGDVQPGSLSEAADKSQQLTGKHGSK